jgi:hypothetical protein
MKRRNAGLTFARAARLEAKRRRDAGIALARVLLGDPKRCDYGIALAGGLVVALAFVVARDAGGRYIGTITAATLVVAGMALNHTIPRGPLLTVTYRNPQAGGQALLWRHPLDAYLQIAVANLGPGTAETVEVEFDNIDLPVASESGGAADRVYLLDLVSPPRYQGKERLLQPGDEWPIAQIRIGTPGTAQAMTSTTARWRARARHMREQTGTILVTVVDEPPQT